MDTSTLASRLDRVQVVDVREEDEWAEGHLDGAVHLPLDRLEAAAGTLDPALPVVAVCRSGERSAEAVGTLRAAGFDADHLDGGLEAWVAAGQPLVSEHGHAGSLDPGHHHGGHALEVGGDLDPDDAAQLHGSFVELMLAVQERFGEREPSEAEIRAFLRERLEGEGRTPEEIEEILGAL